MLSSATASFIFHALSIVALVWFLFLVYRARAIRAWTRVAGTVIESRVASDADMNRFPVVRYKYAVQGKEYISDRILPHGRFATTGGNAQRVVEKYRQGRQVQVYVDPARPSDSALEPKIPVLVYVALLVAAIAFWWIGAMIPAGFASEGVAGGRSASVARAAENL